MNSTSAPIFQDFTACGSRLQDATIIGGSPNDISPDWGRPVTISWAGPERGCRSLNWHPLTGSIGSLFCNIFARHPVVATKDGAIFFPGSLNGAQRVGSNVVSFDVLGFDVDDGQSLDDAIARLRNSGLMAAVYTTHSHRLTGKDKFRVMLPLANTYVLREAELSARKLEWAQRVHAVGSKLRLNYDPTGADINRAFNAPRHRRGAPWAAYIILGDLLDLPEIELSQQNTPCCKQFVARTSVGSNAPKSKRLLNRIKRLLERFEHRFELTNFLDAVGWEHERSTRMHVRCPNDAEHSEPGGALNSSCVAWAPRDSPSGRALLKCQHSHCLHLDTASMLTMMIEQIETDTDLVDQMVDYVT